MSVGDGITVELGEDWSLAGVASGGLDAMLRSRSHALVLQLRRERWRETGPVEAGTMLWWLGEQRWASPPRDERSIAGSVTVASAVFDHAPGSDAIALEMFASDGRAVANAATFGAPDSIAALRTEAERLLASLRFGG